MSIVKLAVIKLENMKSFTLILLALVFSVGCQAKNKQQANDNHTSQNLEIATLAGGCFWCTEASFERIKGVTKVISGYSGGNKSDATYKKVSYGKTKHAESIQIHFDPKVIDYATLLDIFFIAHDPTQLNRQGNDAGTQYRSAIFYHNAEQKAIAEQKLKSLAKEFSKPIVTELNEFEAFYPAEGYHQDFEKRNPNHPYVQAVSVPKIKKVENKFKVLLKD